MTDFSAVKDGQKTYQKIGGWLILCAVGLLLYPVQTAVSLYTEIIPALSSENWSLLTSPHSVSYHPLWGPTLIMELVGNVCFLVLSLLVVVFFFKRRKVVPNLVIVFLASNLIFVGFDCYLAGVVLKKAHPAELQPPVNFFRTIAASIIWISYFIFSKRVKKTFTK